MSVGYLILAIFCIMVGWCKLPSTLAEVRSPLAPYRAVAAVFYLIIGLLFWFAGIGITAAVVVTGA